MPVPANRRRPVRRRQRIIVLVLTLAVAAGLVGATPATARPSPAAPPVPVLSWGPCADGSPAALNDFVCATATVPLDYAQPAGATITLAVVKHAATDAARRVGTLFVNPGGPGGTGTGQVTAWLGLFPEAVRQRFDIVSWDPRGIGQSTPVQCFDSVEALGAFLGDTPEFPVDAAEQGRYLETWRRFGEQCGRRAGPLLAHVSTAEVARDLDLLRQAAGEESLTYWGLSYGTFLGATYANLFPEKVRALVLDGNLAPSNWTAAGDRDPAVGINSRIGTDLGAALNLEALLTLCGEVSVARCAFAAGGPAATKAKFDALLARLAAGPITVGSGDDAPTVTYAGLLSELSNGLDIVPRYVNMQDPGGSIGGWAGVAASLQRIWLAAESPTPVPSVLVAPSTGTPSAPPSPPAPYGGPEGPLAIMCGDSPQPRDPAVYRYLASAVVRRGGPISLAGLWSDAQCLGWAVTSPAAYRGPWDRPTPPILLIGNTADPSTPYLNSLKMAQELANARLLTVQGYGHTSLLNPSSCANAAIAAYLIDGTLPPAGTVCQQDFVPFPEVSTP